jgi:hypothetical protein
LGHAGAKLEQGISAVKHREGLGPIYKAGGGGRQLVGEVNGADGNGLSIPTISKP